MEKNELEQAFNLAVEKQNEGKIEEAEKLYRSILDIDAKHPGSNHNLGALLLSKLELASALKFFGIALISSPLTELYWKNYIYCLWFLSSSGKLYAEFQDGINYVIDTVLMFIADNLQIPDFGSRLGKRPEGLNFLLLGTCQSEFLLSFAQSINCNIDHYLFESIPEVLLPDFKNKNDKEYDAATVVFSLRHIVGSAVSKVIPDVNGDLFFAAAKTEKDVADTLYECKNILSSLIFQIKESVGKELPVFFTGFFEPLSSYPGFFSSRFDYGDPRYFVYKLNEILYNLLKENGGGNSYFIDADEISDRLGKVKIQDDLYIHTTHNGYIGQDYFKPEFNLSIYGRDLWNRIIGQIKVLRKLEQIKLIILDLDYTLWRGIAAESIDDEINPGNLTEGWPLGFVEALLFYKKRGGLLAICSKNDTTEGERLFKKIWGGRLSFDDFVSIKINWNAKSSNIKEILNECNILEENTLFIDDNPREIEEVKNVFPKMRFLTGIQLDWRRIITESPETQTDIVTEESKNRTALVKSKIERDRLKKTDNTINKENWLYELNLTQSFHIIKNEKDKFFPRAKELLNKTNQFNTTGKRWDDGTLSIFFNDGGFIVSTFVKDKLIDNGLVGLALIQDNIIEQAVLSCRVFGLGIEQALLAYSLKLVFDKYDSVLALFKDAGKNFTCKDYYVDNGFTKEKDNYEDCDVSKTNKMVEYPSWIKIV